MRQRRFSPNPISAEQQESSSSSLVVVPLLLLFQRNIKKGEPPGMAGRISPGPCFINQHLLVLAAPEPRLDPTGIEEKPHDASALQLFIGLLLRLDPTQRNSFHAETPITGFIAASATRFSDRTSHQPTIPFLL